MIVAVGLDGTLGALAMGAIYAQVTVKDMVVARYIAIVAFLHGRGGFDLVLASMAGVAFLLMLGVFGIAAIINRYEGAAVAAQPAE